MADLSSWIGGTISYLAKLRDIDATSSDYTSAGSYLEVGNVKSISAAGDTSAAINVSLLKSGRVTKVNGEKDGGELTISVAFDASDSSYAAVRAYANTNTNIWFKISDPGSKYLYTQGLIANWQETERNNTTEMGATFVIRVNAGFVHV